MAYSETSSISTSSLWRGSTLFLAVFLFHLADIFQGIDLTDYGAHLTNQVAAFPAPASEPPFPLYFLSDYMGGMWLKVVGGPSLLWARFGGVLLVAFCALISYQILLTYFDRRRTWLVVFGSSLVVTTCWFCYLIDYYAFPSLLLCLFLYALNHVLHTPPLHWSFRACAFLAGFLGFTVILARISLMTILLLPIILALYHARFHDLLPDRDAALVRKSMALQLL